MQLTRIMGMLVMVSLAVAVHPLGAGAASARTGPPTVPAAPTIGGAFTGNASAEVGWAAPSDTGGDPLTGYVVTPFLGSTALSAQTFSTSNTNVVVAGLTNGSTYTFKVAATNAVGTGAQSASSNSVAIGVPRAPGLQSAVPGNGTARVSWYPGSANAAPITGYVITPHVGFTGLPAQTFSTPAAADTVTGLTNGTHYTFSIAARNKYGTGLPSTPTAAIIEGTPAVPGYVNAVPGNGTARVSWLPPAANASPITGYVITTYDGTVGTPQTFSSTASAEVITGLTNGTFYSFTVAALNSLGSGPASGRSGTTVGAPVAPTSVSAVPGNGTARLTWTAPATNGSAITRYHVNIYSGGSVSSQDFLSAATAEVVTGLTNGTSYTFTVSAQNGVGSGPYSAASAAIVAGAPGVPGYQTASPGNGTARVSWLPPAANGSAITGYVITPYAGTTALAAQTFATPNGYDTVTGLTNGTSYTFKVAAVNSFGTGPPSAPTPAVVVGAPVAPAAPTAAAGSMQVSLSWVAPVANASAITGYTVTPFKAGVAQAPIVFAGTATTEVITGLTSGTSYTFTVAATNAVGTGPASKPSTAVAPT